MFCTKCGKQIPDSTKFCPYCGANCSPEQDIASQASQVFNKAEQELGSAFNEVKQSFTGSNNQNNRKKPASALKSWCRPMTVLRLPKPT